MGMIQGEAQKQAIIDVCEALAGVREVVKGRIAKFKCHTIPISEVEEIRSVCQKIQTVLQVLNIESEAFNKVYEGFDNLILHRNTYEISVFFDKKAIPLLDESINELDTYMEPINGKRTIKVKYVDFYPEFKPREHWLYKLLIKKYNVVFSDAPDYLFFSCFGNRYLTYDCVRIFISNEAVYPNLNLYDYSVTYADFTITDRLLPNKDAFEDLQHRRLAYDEAEAYELLQQKKDFCNFVYSNGLGDPFRKELFDALSCYKTVKAGGKFLNNIGYRVEDLQEFQSNFKFSIACENSFYRGYTTEKIVNAFNAKTIPIYWGNMDISQIVNPKAIINCHDFPNLDSIVEEIKRLDSDDAAYMEKLQEPILVDKDMINNYLAERESFIYHIIDQPYSEAFRRNQGLRGQWYNDFMCYALGYPNEWFSPEKDYFVKKKR